MKCLLICLLMLLNFMGCKPEDGRAGPTRSAFKIVVGNDVIHWTMEGGQPAYCWSNAWLWYEDFFGNKIDQEGLQMVCHDQENTYWKDGSYWPTTNTNMIGTEVTDEYGQVELKGERVWIQQDVSLYQARRNYRSPSSFECRASVSLCSSGGTTVETFPKFEWWLAEWTVGYATHVGLMEPPAGNQPASLSSEEIAFLENETYPAPPSGVSAEYGIVQQRGNNGLGYVKDMNGFAPFVTLNRPSPMMFSIRLCTATPQDIVGTSVAATITSELLDTSIDTTLTAVASSLDNLRHIITSGYFIPMKDGHVPSPATEVFDRWSPPDYPDQNLNIDDPNFVPDPNRLQVVPILPMAPDDDYVIITINNEDIVFNSISKWLSSDKTYDLQPDGIINFNDYAMLLGM